MKARHFVYLLLAGTVSLSGCHRSSDSHEAIDSAPEVAVGVAPSVVDEEADEHVTEEETVAPIPEDAVAVLDGVAVLTRPDLDANLAEIVERFEALPGREATTPRWRNQRRRRIVQQAVHDHLVDAYVASRNVEVTDEEVAASVRADLDYVFDDERLFDRFLQSQHTTREEYMLRRRHELVEMRVLAERGSLEPSDEELQSFYEDNRERWHEEDRALASEMTIRLRSDAPDDRVADALSRLNAARDRVIAGERFEDVAREISESGDSVRGGEMGWIVRGRRQQLAQDGVEALLFSAEIGEISEPIRTQLGWQIFLVRDRRDAGVRDLDEVRDIIYQPLARRLRDRLRRDLVNELLEDTEVTYFEDRWGLEDEGTE